MKNFVQPANVITVIAPAGGIKSGQLYVGAAIVGVAACDALVGEEVEVRVEGAFDLPKVPADALTRDSVAKATIAAGIGTVATAGTRTIGWGSRRRRRARLRRGCAWCQASPDRRPLSRRERKSPRQRARGNSIRSPFPSKLLANGRAERADDHAPDAVPYVRLVPDS